MEALNLFKQTDFSNTIWWRVNNDIRGYKNDKIDGILTFSNNANLDLP